MATLAELLSSPWTQQQAQGVADYKRQRRAYDRQEDYNFNQQNRLMEEARLTAIADRKKEEEELKQKAEEAKRNEQVYGAFDRYFYGLNPESRVRYDVGATRAMSPQEAAAMLARIQSQEAMLEGRRYSEGQRDEGRRYSEEQTKQTERKQETKNWFAQVDAERRAEKARNQAQMDMLEQRRYAAAQDAANKDYQAKQAAIARAFQAEQAEIAFNRSQAAKGGGSGEGNREIYVNIPQKTSPQAQSGGLVDRGNTGEFLGVSGPSSELGAYDGGGFVGGGDGGGSGGGEGFYKGGLVRQKHLRGPDPIGPDTGWGKLQHGEFVIPRHVVKRMGVKKLSSLIK